MHSLPVCHRDIKSENMLLDSQGNIKICDFGGSAQLVTLEDKRFTEYGTRDMLAPEVLSGVGYTSSVDSWGLGACWIQMLGTKNGIWNKFVSLTSIGTDLTQTQINDLIDTLDQSTDIPDFSPITTNTNSDITNK